MAETVAQTIADFLLRYPDAGDSGDALPLRLLNRVDAELCSLHPLRHKTFSIDLVADQREYVMKTLDTNDGANIVRVYGADYVRSANAGDTRSLGATNPRYLDLQYPNWRNQISGEPGMFYVDAAGAGRVFGLHSKPQYSTSGGYPIIRAYCSIKKVLASDGSLPDDLLTNEVYVAGMCAMYARTNDREALEGWQNAYKYEQRELEKYLNGFVQPDNPRIIPGIRPNFGVT